VAQAAMAYLGKLQTYYLERGDQSKAYIIKDRLELLKKVIGLSTNQIIF